MTATETQDKAREAAGWFESAKRDNGDYFIRTKEGAPDWVTEIVYAGHHGWSDFLPDDWRYEKIFYALEFIASHDDPEDDSAEFADESVDAYTSDRLAWLISNLNRPAYCDEAIENGMVDPKSGVVEIIGAGQYEEAGEIFALVLRAVEDLAGVES